VRVLDETKQQLGVMPLSDALRLAQTKGLDLIEIAPDAIPPVCRIVDYGKFQYEESKRGGSDSKAAGSKMKEIQLSPNIDPNDFATKLSHAIEFLCDDVRVRIKLRFRGRQKAHKEFGFEVVNRFVKEAAAYGQTDSPPKMAGDRDLSVLISPLAKEKRAKNPRAAATKPPSAKPAAPTAPAVSPSATATTPAPTPEPPAV
jgi:translation initiation factor IF-3